MDKKHQLKNISNEQCREAADMFVLHNRGRNTLVNLVKITGLPEKLCATKLYSLVDKGLMSYGVNVKYAWWNESMLNRPLGKPKVEEDYWTKERMNFAIPIDLELTEIEERIRKAEIPLRDLEVREYDLRDRIDKITDDNKHGEIDSGPPVGKEICECVIHSNY